MIVPVKVEKKKIFKNFLLSGIVIPSVGIYPKETSMLLRYMYTDVHHSVIYNGQKVRKRKREKTGKLF